ncbi:WXG100 family type VII secretion target [Mycobacteroides chelonae]|uniref:WXG100 family type VII secretion target n=1 Tax=Mycobacteroides chelonae TaxID=1774 RepID=UPI0008A8C939|nr:hypothetical protein [Mycobacteroides chelonae]OHU48773.1 hypothetical protein BKG81_15195 [Mycobacteroides chelonae]
MTGPLEVTADAATKNELAREKVNDIRSKFKELEEALPAIKSAWNDGGQEKFDLKQSELNQDAQDIVTLLDDLVNKNDEHIGKKLNFAAGGNQ